MSNIRRNVKLLLVDPQDDFANPKGSLYVSGAEKAMERVAAMIDRVGDKFDQILCSMDSHAVLHIGNTTFWKDSQGLKIINDPAISGQMKLFKNGVKVLFGKDNKLYSLNMKGNKNC